MKQLQEVASQNPGSVLMFAHALGNPPSMKRVMEIVQKYKFHNVVERVDDDIYFYSQVWARSALQFKKILMDINSMHDNRLLETIQKNKGRDNVKSL